MVAMLNCTTLSMLVPNAFLWLYDVTNSHVSLPGKDDSAKYSIWCYLNISTPSGFKIISIPFISNIAYPTECSNPFIYLYYDSNSHVSKIASNIGICLNTSLSNIIKPIWSTTVLQETNTITFVLGLYNETNSHVTTNKSEAEWRLYLNLTDVEPPKTEIEFPQNGTIISSTVFEVRFKDYDNGGLLCFYQVGNNPPKERECNGTIYVSAYDCDNPCIVKSIVVDYGENIDEKTNVYTLQNVPLLIQIEVPEKVVVPISDPVAKFKIKLKNTLDKELVVNITYNINSLEKIPNPLLPKVILSNNIIVLKPGEEKEVEATAIGYRVGNYVITFNFTANNRFNIQRTVLFVVSAVIAGTTIAVIEKILLPLLYLLP